MAFLSVVKNQKVLYDRYIETRPMRPKLIIKIFLKNHLSIKGLDMIIIIHKKKYHRRQRANLDEERRSI